MGNFRDSQSEKNVQQALVNECIAAVVYELFAKQARKDGYVQIADIFQETADNEKAHAKIWLKKLAPGGNMPNTLTNLEWATEAEKEQGEVGYRKMAETAREEGLDDLAQLLETLSSLEAGHEKRFQKLAENIKEDDVFERPKPVLWQCLECGHVVEAEEAPEKCPVCGHPQAYFQIRCENY